MIPQRMKVLKEISPTFGTFLFEALARSLKVTGVKKLGRASGSVM